MKGGIVLWNLRQETSPVLPAEEPAVLFSEASTNAQTTSCDLLRLNQMDVRSMLRIYHPITPHGGAEDPQIALGWRNGVKLQGRIKAEEMKTWMNEWKGSILWSRQQTRRLSEEKDACHGGRKRVVLPSVCFSVFGSVVFGPLSPLRSLGSGPAGWSFCDLGVFLCCHISVN